MAGEGIHATGNTPYVEIVYVPYPFDLLHIIDKRCHGDIFRHGFQQDVSGLTQNLPRAHSDKRGNANRKQWVSQCPACQKNDDTGGDHTDGGNHIPKDVEGRGAHIEAMALFLQAKTDEKVDSYANTC